MLPCHPGRWGEEMVFAPTKIFVKDFGPVRKACIDLRKVTILMGPNNTGKTYTAVLMLVLEQLVAGWRVAPAFLRLTQLTLEEFMQQLDEVLVDNLLRLYSVNRPEDLVRRGSDKAELRFVLKPEGEQIGDILELEIEIDKSGVVTSRFHEFRELLETKKAVPEIAPLVYIPAERAGIVRTLRQLLRLHIETSWHMVPPHLTQLMMSERIRFPGVVGVLLDQILNTEKFTLEERKGAFVAPALDLLEEEVLHGRLEMDEDLSVTYHETGAGKPIDLINASSMVSELSAIYLLSGKLRKGWWLIVEEPEAHVHPMGQMGLARFMAALARLGVNVMATTHSDIIALKLAQMVGLAGLTPEERKRFGYTEDEYLTKEEFALYFMEPTEDGSIARKIDVSETGEVSELPTYTNVMEEMYREAVRLLELHGKIPKISEGRHGEVRCSKVPAPEGVGRSHRAPLRAPSGVLGGRPMGLRRRLLSGGWPSRTRPDARPASCFLSPRGDGDEVRT
jgi:predicted ATPase